jgi:Integrase core domain
VRDELLNGEIFYSLKEAQAVIEKWRIHYNGDPIRCSVTDLRHHSPSRRHHQTSTGLRSCNNLSLRRVQNIGQVNAM